KKKKKKKKNYVYIYINIYVYIYECIQINGIRNIHQCSRFRKTFDFLVLRMELFVGTARYEDAAWDIRIPGNTMSETIVLPPESSTFSTLSSEIFYSELPVEACWCFTIYGVEERSHKIKEEKGKRESKTKNKPQMFNSEFLGIGNGDSNDSTVSGAGFSAFRTPSISNDDDNKSTTSLGTMDTASVVTNITCAYANDDTERMVIDDLEDIVPFSETEEYEVSECHRNNNTPLFFFFLLCIILFVYAYAKLELALNSLKWHSEPLAWCRLPLIDEQHKIRDGKAKLRLWDVPVWTYVKGGPKVDPYTTGFWKKFGTTAQPKLSEHATQVYREREKQRSKDLKSQKKKSSRKSHQIKINHVFASENQAEFAENEEDLLGVQIHIEFPYYPFHVVAPI
ncbi:hypothetical protein RFI_27316, partial [Reticulomyxa filosa]